mmetsp:Transcript_5107/g.15576  ORF Transcript_5107/g.15576 Transcript_5107/m.15576 type:complete len:507 (+) Transcript_5107:157-1677(+)
MLVAGSAVASLGGESLQTIDDADLKRLALDTVFIASTAATLCFSLWVIFISSNLIMLSQMTALTGTSANDVKTADEILARKIAEVRSFYLLSLITLLSSALSMMWMNLTIVNSLVATAIFSAISVHAFITLRDTSEEFHEKTTFTGEDPVLHGIQRTQEALSEVFSSFCPRSCYDMFCHLCLRRRRRRGDEHSVAASGSGEVMSRAGWARLHDSLPTGQHELSALTRWAQGKPDQGKDVLRSATCQTDLLGTPGNPTASRADERRVVAVRNDARWSKPENGIAWGLGLGDVNTSLSPRYQGWMFKSKSVDGPLRPRERVTPIDHLRAAFDALRADPNAVAVAVRSTPQSGNAVRTDAPNAEVGFGGALMAARTMSGPPFATPQAPLRDRRWFILRGQTLSWYASDDEYTLRMAPKASVALAGYMVQETFEPPPSGRQALMLLPRTAYLERHGAYNAAIMSAKSWYLRAGSGNETRHWFEQLSAAIRRADAAIEGPHANNSHLSTGL